MHVKQTCQKMRASYFPIKGGKLLELGNDGMTDSGTPIVDHIVENSENNTSPIDRKALKFGEWVQ